MADIANQSWHSFLLSPDSASGIIIGAKSITFNNSCLRNCDENASTFTPSLGTALLGGKHGNVNSAGSLRKNYQILTYLKILLHLWKFLYFRDIFKTMQISNKMAASCFKPCWEGKINRIVLDTAWTWAIEEWALGS